jgi:phosphate transport system permease protein
MTNRASQIELEEFLIADLVKPLPLWRTLFTYGMNFLAFALTGLALLPLFGILFSILRQGLPQLKLETLTSLPAPVGVEGTVNGFGNAIIGTLIMVGIASLISIPFGLMTGIYLSEFGKDSKRASIIRFITTVLTGIPSVIIGVFAYAVVVLTKVAIQNGQIYFGAEQVSNLTGGVPIPGFAIAIGNLFNLDLNTLAITLGGFSALAGGFALSILMLPVVALTTEEALKLVPVPQRLASAALGANRFQTTFKIVVSAALPGVTTGILLAVARAAGETAPLVFTALFSDQWPDGILNPTPSLSVLIYNYANSPFPEQNNLAWTASVVLVALILIISVASRFFTRRK